VCNGSTDGDPPLELPERTEQDPGFSRLAAADEVGELSRALVALRIVRVF